MISKYMLYTINLIKEQEKIRLLKSGIKNNYGEKKNFLKQELEKLNE